MQQLPSPTGAIDPGVHLAAAGRPDERGNFTAYPFGVVHDNHTWTQPTYRVTLSHQFTPDIFGYCTY